MAIARVTTLTTPGNDTQATAAVASSTIKKDASTDTNTKDASTEASDQTVTTQPAIQYIVFAIGTAAIGFVLGLYLQDHFHHNMTKLPVLATGVGSFALIYIMAQAIERILVPFSWLGGGFLGGCGTAPGFFHSKNDLKKQRQSALLKTAQALTSSQGNAKKLSKESAETKHSLDQYTANLTGSSFGLAAALAMTVSGYTGTFLLRTVGLTTAGWLDVLVTGLVIGGGTKPLHDLISNISSSSQNKDSATSA